MSTRCILHFVIQDVFSRVYISRVTIDYIHCAASFPGTKRFSGNPSLFAGVPMMFPTILGNQSKMELLYQEKEFVAGRMSGNEQLGNNSRETRGACKQITAAQCSVVQSHVCSRTSTCTSRRDATSWLTLISRHAPCNILLLLVQNFHFRLIPQELQGISSEFPQKGWNSRNIFEYQGRMQAL